MPTRKTTRRTRGTGSIFFHAARGVWVGRIKVDGRRVERSHKTQAELVRLLGRARPAGPDTLLRDWYAGWLDRCDVRPQTRAGRQTSGRLHIIPALGHLRVAAVTTGQIERAVASWTSLKSPNALRVVLSHLQTCLQAAVREGIRTDNPARAARAPRACRADIDPFTAAQLAAVVRAAAAHPRLRVFALLASVGCRVGEALALDCQDFDPHAGTVSVSRTQHLDGNSGPPKSANGVRTVRVPAAARPALEAARGGRKSGPLFTGPRGRMTHGGARRAWEVLLRNLGIPYRNPHQLRHAVVSVALARGVPVADVARDLGDTPATIIRTYCHPTNAHVADAMDEAFGAAVERQSGGRGAARKAESPGNPRRKTRSGKS